MKFTGGKDLMTGAEMADAAKTWRALYGIEPAAPALAPVGDLPFLTPETWPGVRCFCGTCDTCSWYAVLKACVAADAHRDGRPPESNLTNTPDAPRWRSVAQALQTLGTSGGRGDARSGLGAQLEELRVYGTSVQRERGRGGNTRSDDLVDLERALELTLPLDQCEGLTLQQATTAVLLRVVGSWQRQADPDSYGRPWTKREKPAEDEVARRFGVEPQAIRRIVKRALHGLRVELGARGLTPMPKMGTRAHHEAHHRKDELDSRRTG